MNPSAAAEAYRRANTVASGRAVNTATQGRQAAWDQHVETALNLIGAAR